MGAGAHAGLGRWRGGGAGRRHGRGRALDLALCSRSRSGRGFCCGRTGGRDIAVAHPAGAGPQGRLVGGGKHDRLRPGRGAGRWCGQRISVGLLAGDPAPGSSDHRCCDGRDIATPRSRQGGASTLPFRANAAHQHVSSLPGDQRCLGPRLRLLQPRPACPAAAATGRLTFAGRSWTRAARRSGSHSCGTACLRPAGLTRLSRAADILSRTPHQIEAP